MHATDRWISPYISLSLISSHPLGPGAAVADDSAALDRGAVLQTVQDAIRAQAEGGPLVGGDPFGGLLTPAAAANTPAYRQCVPAVPAAHLA